MQNLTKEDSAIKLEVKLEHLEIWRLYIDQYLNFGTLFYFLFCLGLFGFTILLFYRRTLLILNR